MPLNPVNDSPIVELGRWMATDPGRLALAWEQERLDELVTDIFGFFAVQAGLHELDALRANRIAFRGLVAEGVPAAAARLPGRAVVVARPEDLPFEAQSLDLLVLPHTLECSADPHRVLREAERVLMPDGRLLITGFNPWSMWGGRQVLGWRSPFLPRGIRPLSHPRIRDWLELLSFDADSDFGAYRPPCRTDKWLRRWAFLDRAGHRWLPFCGGLYVVAAVKRVAGMRVIGPAWTNPRRARPAAAVATPRVHARGRATPLD